MLHKLKKRRLPLLAGAGLLLIVLVAILIPRDVDSARAQGSVQSAEAVIGTLATTVTGTGNLETEGGLALTIPAGLTVLDVYARPGDIVSAGDVLAVFDLGSIHSRIAAVQDALEALDRDIEQVRTDTEPMRITARVSGVVATIYAAEGDSVIETMLRRGALLTLSLDDYQTLSVTGTSGRVARVHVSEGDRVRAGATLFTLADVDASPAYLELLRDRTEQAAILHSLLALAQTGELVADFDGIVERVAIGDDVGGSNQGGGLPAGLPAGLPPGLALPMHYGGNDLDIVRLAVSEPLTEPQPTEITSIADITLAPPVLGATPQTAVSGNGYSGTVQWMPTTAVFMPDTVYQAAIILTANSGHVFGQAVLTALETEGFPTPGATVTMAEIMGNMLAVGVSFPATAEMPGGPDVPGFPEMPEMPGMPSFNMPSFSMPAMPGGMDMGAMPASNNPNEITAFTIAPADTMQLVVHIDERDILDLQVGQRAEVSLDAIEGERFPGELSRIDLLGTAAGGGARYAVEITIPRTAGMLPGMSASAVITTQEVSGVLLLPAEAVQEDGEMITVYTVLSGNEPRDPVEVQTGLSDGVYVEIVSGLSPGDTVYYIVVETFRWPHWGMGGGGGGFGPGGGGSDTQ